MPVSIKSDRTPLILEDNQHMIYTFEAIFGRTHKNIIIEKNLATLIRNFLDATDRWRVNLSAVLFDINVPGGLEQDVQEFLRIANPKYTNSFLSSGPEIYAKTYELLSVARDILQPEIRKSLQNLGRVGVENYFHPVILLPGQEEVLTFFENYPEDEKKNITCILKPFDSVLLTTAVLQLEENPDVNQKSVVDLQRTNLGYHFG